MGRKPDWRKCSVEVPDPLRHWSLCICSTSTSASHYVTRRSPIFTYLPICGFTSAMTHCMMLQSLTEASILHHIQSKGVRRRPTVLSSAHSLCQPPAGKKRDEPLLTLKVIFFLFTLSMRTLLSVLIPPPRTGAHTGGKRPQSISTSTCRRRG